MGPIVRRGRRRQRASRVAPAALATLLLGGCGGPDAGTSDPSGSPTGSPAAGETSSEGALALRVPEAVPGRCRPPDVALLRRQDVAVRGEVAEVDARVVRLRVLEAYRGEPGGSVEVDAVPGALADLLLAPDLAPGATYLLAARDGVLAVCGASGPDTAALRRVYERAYGAPR